MFALFTDETNLPSDPRAKFFAYGGLIVPIQALPLLHERVALIRQNAGYRPEDELKFETNARPRHVSISAATTAKSQVVDLCVELDCKFIVYIVLHAISRNTPQADLIKWGADHVIGKFNVFLRENNSHGIVALDRLSSSQEYRLLAEKFNHGLLLSDNEHVALDRVSLFTSTCMNASHACSAMDIVLGTFRYCINQPPNVAAARVMMLNISRLIWCTQDGEKIYAFEKGLIFRPKEIKVERYKKEYDDLLAHINALIAETNNERAPER